MTQQRDRIVELMLQTGHAHHQAFIETDGDDSDWPAWYADYLYERLPAILGMGFTKDELAELLVELDEKQKREAPGADWPGYYADELIIRHSAEG